MTDAGKGAGGLDGTRSRPDGVWPRPDGQWTRSWDLRVRLWLGARIQSQDSLRTGPPGDDPRLYRYPSDGTGPGRAD